MALNCQASPLASRFLFLPFHLLYLQKVDSKFRTELIMFLNIRCIVFLPVWFSLDLSNGGMNLFNLQLLDEEDRNRILGPHQKVREWVENTRNATNPHFDEVHKLLFKLKETLQKRRSEKLTSKM